MYQSLFNQFPLVEHLGIYDNLIYKLYSHKHTLMCIFSIIEIVRDQEMPGERESTTALTLCFDLTHSLVSIPPTPLTEFEQIP